MAVDLFDEMAERIAQRVAAILAERAPPPAATPPQRPQPEYLSTKAAAAALGLGRSTLEGWRAQGKGPKFIKLPGVGGAVRYARADLNEWAAKHRR
jgi:predicted DNA-binding transcriptional regulator AlpA